MAEHVPTPVKLVSTSNDTDDWQVELIDGSPAIANFIAFNYADGEEPEFDDEELLPGTTIIICSCCIERV